MATTMGKARATDFTVIPGGTYRVRLGPVTATEHPEYGDGLEWTFDLIDPEDAELARTLREAGERFTQRTGLIGGPNSKPRRWVESLIRRPLDEDEEVTSSMVEGLIADAVVINKPNRKGVMTHYIEALVPVKKAKAPTPEPTPAPVEDAGADEELPF